MVALDLLWWAASTRIAKPIFVRIAVAIFALAPINGTDLAAGPAFCARGIDRPVLEVRTRKRIHLAHDYPATSLVAGNCASADPRDARSRPERSAPR